MSLYDDEDLDIGSTGWTPGGMKLLQTHVQLKKVAKGAKSKQQARIAPVVDLKSAKDFGFTFPKAAGPSFLKNSRETRGASSALIPGSVSLLYSDMSTPIVDEYDPMKPNDYEKAVKVLRARQEEKRTEVDKHREKDRHERDTRRKSSEKDRDRDRDRDREREKDRDRDRSRNDKDRDRDRRRTREDSPPAGVRIPEGFCKVRGESDDEDDEPIRSDKSKEKSRKDRAGAMIAPPPSLQEKESSGGGGGGGGGPGGGSGSGLAFAAKIMAKYGYKEGQGLGKHEHGISTALQVEKTSRRGGRIIGEKSLMPPPPGALGGSPSAGPSSAMDEIVSLMPPPPPPPLPGSMPPPPPPMLGGFGGGGGFGGSGASGPAVEEKKEDENSITEIMKHPSKVALLRNMVGPGEVDGELEPEVKDECTTKYGDVLKVIIFEMPERPADEAVRIFVEFRRMESAIKAVVDLNGRFFGGRQVKAGFYDQQRFNSLQLAD